MKKRLILYYITLMLICPVLPVGAISDTQKEAISEHCAAMKDDLRSVQRADARARVFFGGHYETILAKFVVPLNVKLVENNISNVGLIENQNNLAKAKVAFSDDFIKYQQALEELITIDCKTEPEGFYEKLMVARRRRKAVEQDAATMRGVVSEHVELVNNLKGKL